MKRKLFYSKRVDEPGGARPDNYEALNDREPASEDKANLVSSVIESDRSDSTRHMPVIDIDRIPVRVVPSSTPGNCHLYIDKPVSWFLYRRLLVALRDCGIIEEGYFNASDARGMTFVRKPGHRKPLRVMEYDS